MDQPLTIGPNAPSDVILDRLSRLHPKIIDLSLGRTEGLLEELDNPQLSLPPVVHVAGTNGKGSTIAFLRAMLEAAGYAVHAYTSPHLIHYRERIRLAGELIAEEALVELLEECERANQGRPITEFEVGTVAALLAFSRAPADVLLLEVGLGGRFDATNVVAQPALSLITPVSLDHQHYLGEDLAAIAFEKAGILKRNTPTVVAAQERHSLEVILARARELGAPVSLAGRDWWATAGTHNFKYRDKNGDVTFALPSLSGAHQVANAGAALAALTALPQFDVDLKAQATGLLQTKWPARLQRLEAGALAARLPNRAELWLDGGHNPAAGTALAQAMAAMADVGEKRPLYLVVGMLANKDAHGFLAPLAAISTGLWAVPVPGRSACLTPGELAAAAQALGLPGATASNVVEALEKIAAQTSTAPMRVLVCGSLYLAGAVLGQNGK